MALVARLNAASAARLSPCARVRGPQADERPRVLRIQLERAAEQRHRRCGIVVEERDESGAVVRVHRELRGIELRRTDRDLAIELLPRFLRVALREPHEAEQPVQPFGRIPLPQVGLPILHDRAFAQHRFGAVERAARDVHHRRLEMRERKVGIQLHRARQRAQPVFSPVRMREPELVAPVAGLERDRAARRGERFAEAAGAHEQEREASRALPRDRARSSMARRT